MGISYSRLTFLVAAAVISTTASAGPKGEPGFDWATVVNNNDVMPPLEVRNFNSYNQPSVNIDGLVVFRARSRGGPPLGPPTHGIYVRDMSAPDSEIDMILDKTTPVPHPNNLGTVFVETPSFPRIDMNFDTIATRGNHQPSWRYYLDDGTETRAGTTGIYTNPHGSLISGAAKLGDVSGFRFFRVPEFNNIRFEVFPGAPAVTAGNTIVFKGNYTVNDVGKTGVYFRHLYNEHAGGSSPAIMIANNSDTLIPGTGQVFGSTAPPSAARGRAVFAGFDNEDAPTLGGIYLAPLQFAPALTPLVQIGESVPGAAPGDTFNNLGEGSAFDGRHVGFWGAWGTETRTVRLYCAEEGNKDRIAYCNQALVCEDTGETLGHPDSICDDVDDAKFGVSCYQDKQVPVNQGFFVHDIKNHRTHLLVRTGPQFDDLLYWNFSGKTPCVGGGHSEEGGEDDGELARWRSSAFVAVSGRGAAFRAVFKARSGDFENGVFVDPVDGIYLTKGPGRSRITTVVDTTMNGQVLDPEAPDDSTILELGLEREGLRGNWLAINASMGSTEEEEEEEDGMAGIYITSIKQ
jgi:hypothetical protein